MPLLLSPGCLWRSKGVKMTWTKPICWTWNSLEPEIATSCVLVPPTLPRNPSNCWVRPGLFHFFPGCQFGFLAILGEGTKFERGMWCRCCQGWWASKVVHTRGRAQPIPLIVLETALKWFFLHWKMRNWHKRCKINQGLFIWHVEFHVVSSKMFMNVHDTCRDHHIIVQKAGRTSYCSHALVGRADG